MSSRETLDKSTNVLEQTRRLALETEDVAHSTLSELRKQRNQINELKQKTDQTDQNLNQSNKTLNSMNSNCVVS